LCLFADSSSQPPSAEDSPLRFRGRSGAAPSDGSAAGGGRVDADVDLTDAAQPTSSTAANQLVREKGAWLIHKLVHPILISIFIGCKT